MTVARAVNDSVRFCLELAALAGLAVWGWKTGPDGVNVVLAIAAPLAAAVLWGAFVAPKAPAARATRGGSSSSSRSSAAGRSRSPRPARDLGDRPRRRHRRHLVATFVLDQRGRPPLAQPRTTTSRSAPDSAPHTSPGRPSSWRTFASVRSGTRVNFPVAGANRQSPLRPKSVSQTMSLSST